MKKLYTKTFLYKIISNLSYTELANNINNQETILNIQMIQIDCTSLKVSLVQICHEWQQSLINIVLNRLENNLQMIRTLIKNNTEKLVEN